jgi:HprK-related kinase B
MTTMAPSLLHLGFGDVRVDVTGEEKLLRRLAGYFGGFVAQSASATSLPSTLALVEGTAPEPGIALTPWDSRGKDSFGDIDGYRLVRKDRTGVLIQVHGRDWTMQGPLSRNFSQVVNVIGAMYGLRVLARGCAMVHASYVARDGKGLAVVGQSGTGKSSVAVRLLEEGFEFVSNDRLILELNGKDVIGHGLPKLPRVNPGTLLAGAQTRRILDEEARRRYSAMPAEELWAVEDKYDLDVSQALGRRWLLSAPVAGILMLEWRFGNSGLAVTRLRPEQALAALRGVSKDFGSFDQLLCRRTDTALRDAAERVPVFRITGGADPGLLARKIAQREIPELASLA